MILGESLIVLLCASVAWATSVNEICAAQGSDGVLLTAMNCNQYYMCSQGAPLLLNCQADLVFNVAGYCDWANNVNCDDRSVLEVEEAKSAEAGVPIPADATKTCAAEGSDGVLVPAENCAQFYKCSEGLPVVLDCPAGLLYNPGGWCDWPENVNCDDRSVPDVEEEAKSEEAAEKPDETPADSKEVQAPVDAVNRCATEGSDGVLVPAENCAQFYKCSGGRPVVLDCQAGLLYNPGGWCDWPENVNCDDRSVPDVEEEAKSEEAAEKPDETPADSKEVQAPVDVANRCAAEGSDGVLVPAENCAQFHKCSEGLPVVLDCPAGLLYNPGGWCDWPENVNCDDRSVPDVEEEVKSEEAAEKPDETPADSKEVQAPVDVANRCAAEGSDGVLVPAENCAQFHKCSEGLPVVLDCPAGLLYNPGGWCDWPENVNCDDRSVPDVDEEAKSEETAEKPDESPTDSKEVQAPVDAVNRCAAEGSDGVLVPAENCAQFYKCSEGRPVVLDCQAGLLYNPAGYCDWPQNVNCNDRSVPDFEEEAKSEKAAENPGEIPVAPAEV